MSPLESFIDIICRYFDTSFVVLLNLGTKNFSSLGTRATLLGLGNDATCLGLEKFIFCADTTDDLNTVFPWLTCPLCGV